MVENLQPWPVVELTVDDTLLSSVLSTGSVLTGFDASRLSRLLITWAGVSRGKPAGTSSVDFDRRNDAAGPCSWFCNRVDIEGVVPDDFIGCESVALRMLVVVVDEVAEEMTPGREVITSPGGG